MGIAFFAEQWEHIRETYRLWWQGKLERPVVPVILEGRDPGRGRPNVPLLSQETCTDLRISPEEIIDRIDYELSQYIYLGDAFPYFNMDCFGPGVVAAFLGADLENSTGRVWFHPPEVRPLKELHFEYDPRNLWLGRIKDICAAAMDRWQGQVLLGMPDLGGALDILSTFRPSEHLLFDLYDEPEEVKRLVWEIHDLWHRYYNEINEVLMPYSPGYSDWSQIYSEEPSYVLQCDFSYMISPGMFDEFVKPELAESCKKLHNTIFHLDGVGELPHLDSLLQLEDLKAVQWVPGDGKPDQSQWPEVYQKVHQAGKNIQLWHGFDCLDTVSRQINTYRGIHHIPIRAHVSEEAVIRKRLERYGI